MGKNSRSEFLPPKKIFFCFKFAIPPQVGRQAALISTLVKTAVESDDGANEVAIPAVEGDILELILNYMNQHKGTEPPLVDKPLRSKVMKDVCKTSFDAEYIDDIGENRQQLYDLILAANYMDIKSLLHLGCAKVASLIKGQPVEKVKDILAQGSRGPRVYSKADDAVEQKE
jgi:S-phase kinase-associated protein 1